MKASRILVALLVISFAPAQAQAQQPVASSSAAPATSASASTSAPPGSASASAAPQTPPAPKEDPEIVALRDLARQIDALSKGELSAAVDAATLFEVSLSDERALQVERERLRRIISPQPTADKPEPQDPDAGAPEPDPAGERPLLEARLDVDRARLAFYALSKEKRAELLGLHDDKRKKKASAEEQLSEAEKERQRAAAEREKAEREAKAARSEAERRVADERVRLLEIKESQAALSEQLAKDKVAYERLGEDLLTWLRPADEILGAPPRSRPSEAAIDAEYGALVGHLSRTRNELGAAISALHDPPADLRRVGEDLLEALPANVDKTDVVTLREELLEAETQLLTTHTEQRWEQMRQLQKAVDALGARRLELLPLLSGELRGELTGLGPAAVDQAAREIRQVSLVMRYHLQESLRFITHVRTTGNAGDSALLATITALKWLLPIGVFLWWRRRAKALIEKIEEDPKGMKRRRRDRTPLQRAARFYKRIRRPLEWLLLFWAVIALLPAGADDLLEVQLLWTTLRWTLGGQLVVNTIDAMFTEESARKSMLQTAHLRFRTLRMLGRVVVTFGLVLALTSDLVGHGTIYGWVIWLCWLSALPIAILVVHWWRAAVFQLVELQRRKGPILRWVEKTQTGWKSFPAATVGGIFLLGHALAKLLRGRVLGIDVVKRALAYWFRREVAKQSEQRLSKIDDARLDRGLHEALHPEREPLELVSSVADEQVDDVIEHIKQSGGAVFALVGERGSGKTTLLSRIRKRTPATQLITCPVGGIKEFGAKLRETLDLPATATTDDVSTLLNKREGDNALLIDDAHHLIRPVVDGLTEVDDLIELARKSSRSCTWVFALDTAIWQYFKRARNVRPLFDDIILLTPWSEEGIMRLLESRSLEADVDPQFDRLVRELPEEADELEVQDALERARAGYFRLLWDYSLGNPAVSLDMWRDSLRIAPNGDHIVRLVQPPPTDDLERLPDSAIFVLRAVVQLEWANIDDIVEATMLPRREIEDSLRYARVRRYVEDRNGRFRVRWHWFRTITRFLGRRHLLTGPYS